MVNEALRLLRVFNDYKAKDFAEKIGISYSYLSEIEIFGNPNNPEIARNTAKYLAKRQWVIFKVFLTVNKMIC